MREMKTYREYLIEVFTDREEAIAHLEVALEDYQTYGDRDVFLSLLQTVVEAQGGVSELVKQTDIDPQLLSKMLSNADTPLIDTLGTVLKGLGHQLSIKPIENDNTYLETYPVAVGEQNTSAQAIDNPPLETV